jgi:hypothetical protein
MITIKNNCKKVKYAYQEWPHSADTASLHSQKVERREHGYTIISFKIGTIKPEGLPPWNGQWQNNSPQGV